MSFNTHRLRLNQVVESHLYDDDVVANSEEFKGMLATEYIETAQMSGNKPVLKILIEHKDNIIIDESITVNGELYYVREKQPDGQGTISYILEEA